MSLLTKKNFFFLLPVLLLLLLVPNLVEAVEKPKFSAGYALLWAFVSNIFGRTMAMAGWLLDVAISNYVIGFGAYYITIIGEAIDKVWVNVRDAFNITFIFGLVYIGFKMILNSDSSNTRRWLINLIMAALLVNFSLFFTKFVVDLSNIVATQIIVSGFEPALEGTVMPEGVKYSISGTFMNNLGLATSLGKPEPPGNAEAMSEDGSAFSYIFGSMILFIVATFVFGAGAFLLLIRFVVLLFYMVLSPFMFIGWVFPQLQRYTTEYWSGFLGRAFFAPIYFLLLFISAQVLGSISIATGSIDYAAVVSAGGEGTAESFANTLPIFVVSSVFLIVSLIVAQKMGANGAGAVISAGKNLSNKVRRGVTRTAARTTGFAARNTVGRGAELVRRPLDRGLARMGQGGAVSRFAARRLDNTVGAGLRSAENVSVGGSATLAQARERDNKQQAKFNRGADEQARANTLATQRQNAQNADITTEGGRKNRQNAVNAVGGQVRRMSDQEVLDMDYATLSSPEVAQHLTEPHITALRNSGMYTQQQIQGLGNNRDNAFIDEASTSFEQVNSSADELNKAFDQLGQSIRNMPADRKAGLVSRYAAAAQDDTDPTAQAAARTTLARLAPHLTDRDIEQLEQSGRLSATDIQSVRTARNTAQTNIANRNMGAYVAAGHTDPAAQARFTGDRQRALMNNPQQAGQLPVAVFTNSEMRQYITPEAVEQRMRNGLADDKERRDIRDNIDSYIASLAPNEQASVANQWRSWSNRNAHIGSLGLTQINTQPSAPPTQPPAPPTQPPAPSGHGYSPGGIIIPNR